MTDQRKYLDAWLNEPRNPVTNSEDPVTGRLLKAASVGESLEIRYFGGSEPGLKRRIKPLEIFERGDILYVEAHCESRNETRCFKICRIEVEGINKLSFRHETIKKTTVPQNGKGGGGCLVLLLALPAGVLVLQGLSRWL